MSQLSLLPGFVTHDPRLFNIALTSDPAQQLISGYPSTLKMLGLPSSSVSRGPVAVSGKIAVEPRIM